MSQAGNIEQPATPLGRDWYERCLQAIAAIDARATERADLDAALAPWCEFCAAATEALNNESEATSRNVDRRNDAVIARQRLCLR